MRARVLDEAEISRVLGRCDGMERVMILLSVRAGLRATEIAALDWRMVRNAMGGLADVIDLPAIATKGRTGAGVVPIAQDLARALLKWSAARRHPKAGPVIVGPRSEPLSPDAVRLRIRRLYRAVGLDASSHSGRRTFGTRLAAAGLSAFEVQYAMRHADVRTAALYVERSGRDRAVSRHSRRDRVRPLLG